LAKFKPIGSVSNETEQKFKPIGARNGELELRVQLRKDIAATKEANELQEAKRLIEEDHLIETQRKAMALKIEAGERLFKHVMENIYTKDVSDWSHDDEDDMRRLISQANGPLYKKLIDRWIDFMWYYEELESKKGFNDA
jgi:hypothetical protein